MVGRLGGTYLMMSASREIRVGSYPRLRKQQLLDESRNEGTS